MNKDHPCYQCTHRFPGCSGSCQRPEYLEEKRKAAEIKEAIRKDKKRINELDNYTVEQKIKQKRRHR